MKQNSKMILKDSENEFSALSETLMSIGREFYGRGWLFGTSGNMSIVIGKEPLRLAITASGIDKGRLNHDHILEIDECLNVLKGEYMPSSEAALHVSVVRTLGAGAVFHTHSSWITVLSEIYADNGGIEISGYEMLKGLNGVNTHEHSELIPIFENSQDMGKLSIVIEDYLRHNSNVHGFILRGHGLYTWGRNTDEAKRHVEVIEFLMEVVGRTRHA